MGERGRKKRKVRLRDRRREREKAEGETEAERQMDGSQPSPLRLVLFAGKAATHFFFPLLSSALSPSCYLSAQNTED